MSISSDIYITREEAIETVTGILLYEQEKLIRKAVANMEDYELTTYLSNDVYYYNISDSNEDTDESD